MTASEAMPFGTLPDGRAIERVSVTGGALSARFLTYGAILQDLRLAGHPDPLVLGFEDIGHYAGHRLYFGAIVGRYANRIAGAKFALDGERHATDANDHGNTLHGGSQGLDRRVWEIAETGVDFVTFAIRDPDGAMGFPATLDIRCTYRLTPAATLRIELAATSDGATLCNLAHHSYFNLDDGGSGDVLDHRLGIAASAYLPVDHAAIPTGEVMPVEGTDFDFVMPRSMRPGEGRDALYDHNFCLSAARGPLRQVAWVQGARSGVEMEVWTTEPGLQFYAGQFPDLEVPGLGGRRYRSHAGFCLEPQIWPDSPNRPYFPQAILNSGEEYRQVTEYRFRPPLDA